MSRISFTHLFPAAIVCAASLFSGGAYAADEPIVFKSDVALVRVDAQVLDSSKRAITGLNAQDFRLFDEGKEIPIRNFGSEELPVDVLFLIDVSGSMEPHVERLANAAHQALGVLAEGDRVGIMVFDRQTRIRLRLTRNPLAQAAQFDNVLHQEHFNGGTDITRGLLDAAAYIGREGRKDARKAIVILTDDQTERDRDEPRVERALTNADSVLMALLAPDAVGARYPRGGGGGYPGGGYPGGGRRRYPSGGGGLGGIILGGPIGGGGYPGGGYPGGGYPGGGYPGGGYPGGGYPGGGYPGGGGGYPPVIMGGRTHSAGTAEIARQSGGDSNSIDDAGALEDTLQRIRQRYALYFYLPQNAKPGQERKIEVALAASARQRYQGSEVRYRQQYLAPGAGGSDADTTNAEPVISQGPLTPETPASSEDTDAASGLHRRRRPAVDDTGGSRGPVTEPSGGWRRATGGSDRAPSSPDQPSSAPSATADTSGQQQGGWKRATDNSATPAAQPAPVESKTAPAPAADAPAPADTQQQKGGWRRVKPGEQP